MARLPEWGTGVDVGAWLHGLDLGQYEQAFRDNDVDAAVLPDLTADDLVGLGVGSIGHRRKLLAAIAALREGPPSPETRSARAEPAPSAIEPAPVPQFPEAERRQLTVMFVDLVGSTALSSRLDPEDMREVILAYQNTAAGEIARLDGHVAKFLGDGVLAYFGYPRAHEDDAERAARAGLGLVAAVGRLAAPGEAALACRVGIATGLVVVGDLIGEAEARERAVVGETPNLAARLQALAEPGAVVIAETTRRLLGGLFAYRDLGAVALKGFAEPVRAFAVLGAGAAEGRFEALHAAGVTPLVGREHELALLLDRWERAREGEGQVILLAGEAGIGKSRLVRALREHLSDEPHTTLGQFCSPYHANTALHPVIGLLERAAGLRREDPSRTQLDRLEAMLQLATEDVGEAASILADLLAIPAGDCYPPLELSPQRKKERTFQVLLDQLAGLAARGPVLTVYEDLHWADPSTLELLGRVLERVQRQRVLVLVTFRPDFAPPWTGHGHVTALSLSRLGRRQGRAMVGGVTGGKALPAEVLEQILARTDGVPLFVEELTKAVLESGLLRDEGDRYELDGPLPRPAIPATLHDSLTARLDRLAPVKEVAQVGAVIGREFSYALLAAASGLGAAELADTLAKLVASELVFARSEPPGAVYSFKHALVRDAAYASLLKGRRQVLHARVAGAFEERLPDAVAATPEIVAHHLTEAGLGDRAVVYWLRAGRQAAERSVLAEAVAHLARGLDALALAPAGVERDRAELDLQVALGTHLMPLRGWSAPEVERAWTRARELCGRTGDESHLHRVLWGQSVVQHNRPELQAALQTAAELLRHGEERDDLRAATMGHRQLGNTLTHLARFAEARRHFEQAAELGIRAGPTAFADHIYDPVVASRAYLARCLLHTGHPDQQERMIARTLAEAERSGHMPGLAFVLFQAAELGVERRDPRAARTNLGRLIPLAREQGFVLWLAMAGAIDGWIMAEEGEHAGACAKIQDGLATYEAQGVRLVRPFLLAMLGAALGRVGRPDEALAALDAGLALAAEKGEVIWEPELHRLKGGMLLASSSDSKAEAENSYARAIEVARGQEARLAELRAATSLARVWAEGGERRRARDLLAPVHAWFTEGFETPDLKAATALLGALA